MRLTARDHPGRPTTEGCTGCGAEREAIGGHHPGQFVRSPWTEDGFRTSWDKAFRKTSLKDLHFHDLRGTAVTRLALSNCSVPEIASITGHSMTTVQEILDAHYLGGRVELAESAIKKLSELYGYK